MGLATLTNSGRAAIANAIIQRELHLAWGEGDPAWDADDAVLPSLIDWTSLQHEIGRHIVTKKRFCTPDTDGDIVIPTVLTPNGKTSDVRYRLVDEITPYIYMQTKFEFADAARSVVRELGIFMDTKVREEVPKGQRYFTPDQIEDPGIMLTAQLAIPRINRSESFQMLFDFVMPI